MSKFGVILLFTAVLVLALGGSALAQGKFDTSSGAVYGTAVTTSQTAVFAHFLSSSPPLPGASEGIDTLLTMSNPLAGPSGFQSDFVNIGGGDREGTVEVYLWNEDGQLYFWESPLILGPGETMQANLSDILADAGFSPDGIFLGYGWVIANFDGLAGTEAVFIPDVNFAQAFDLSPAAGQGLGDTIGLAVMVP